MISNKLKSKFKEALFHWKLKADFKKPQQIDFIKQLNSYLVSDIGMVEALTSTREQYAATYGKKHVIVQITDNLIKASSTGLGFNNLMAKYFDPIIAVGFELAKQVSGDKSAVLNIVDLVEQEAKLKRNLVTSLAMPGFVFCLGIGAQYVVGGYILPMVPGKTLPDSPEVNFSLSVYSILSSYWPVALFFFCLVFWMFAQGQANWMPNGSFGKNAKRIEDYIGVNSFSLHITKWLSNFRKRLDTVWPFSIYREFWSIRLLRLLGYLKLADVEDIEALKVIGNFSPPYIQYFTKQMIRGTGIGSEKKDYFGKELVSDAQMIRLRRYFENVDNETFARGLVEVSKNAEIDLKLQNGKYITKFQMTGFFLGIILVFLGLGGVLDALAGYQSNL